MRRSRFSAEQIVAVLSVDRPVSGRRPDTTQRRLLERYAAQAEKAVITAFEREALVQQVAHAESARRLVRSASMPSRASLDAVLRHTVAARRATLEALDGIERLIGDLPSLLGAWSGWLTPPSRSWSQCSRTAGSTSPKSTPCASPRTSSSTSGTKRKRSKKPSVIRSGR